MKGYFFYRLRQIWAAIGLVIVAWLIRTLIDPVVGERVPYTFFIIASIVAAWTLDIRSTALTVLLGWFVANWFFEEPRHSLSIEGAYHWITSLTYVVIGLAVVWFAKSEQAASLRELAALAEARRRKASEADFRRLFEQAPVGLAELDALTGRVVRANALWCNSLGWAPGILPDKSLSELVPSSEAQELWQAVRNFVDSGKPGLVRQTRLIHTDGGLLPVMLRIAPIRKADTRQTSLLAAMEKTGEPIS